MQLKKLLIGLMATTLLSLFFVQVYAVDTEFTCCITTGGDIKNCQAGLIPAKVCTGQSAQLTLTTKARTDQLQTDLETEIADRMAADTAEAAARAAADNAETTARIAADAALQSQITTNAGSAGTAHTNLQNQITTNATEIGKNTDEIMVGNGMDRNSSKIDINFEAQTRHRHELTDNGASGLPSSRIDGHESDIGFNISSIQRLGEELIGTGTGLGDTRVDRNTDEIIGGGNYNPSRIDILEEDVAAIDTSELVQGVIATDSGSIGHGGNYYRTITYNPDSGELVFRGEFNHSLDPVNIDNGETPDGFWYCTVGDRVVNGDIQRLLGLQPNDNSLAIAAGFYPGATGGLCDSGGCWAYEFENLHGGGTSPYFHLKVENAAGTYVDINFNPAYPLRGWFFGPKDLLSHQGTDQVYIALSNKDLKPLLIANGFTQADLPVSVDDVVVALDKQVTNLLFKPDGDPR